MNLALVFPEHCHCGEAFVILRTGDLGESSLLTSASYCVFFKCLFALRNNGRNSTDHCAFVCSSHSEQGHFSEDFLNNMSLDSQLEWFNCFWIHTGGMLCEGQKSNHLAKFTTFPALQCLEVQSGLCLWGRGVQVGPGSRHSPVQWGDALKLTDGVLFNWRIQGLLLFFNLGQPCLFSCWGKWIVQKVGVWAGSVFFKSSGPRIVRLWCICP